jgi:hypothetical protein
MCFFSSVIDKYLLEMKKLVKSHKTDDTVKSSRCKARKYEGMKRTYGYAAMTEDVAQRSRWTFYEVVKNNRKCLKDCQELKKRGHQLL